MRDSWTPDRRRADRRRVPFPMTATHLDTGVQWPVIEVGRLGIVIEAPGPLSVGTTVTVRVDADATSMGPLEARIAHSRLLLGARGTRPIYLAGLSFGRLSTRAESQLEALLAQLGAAAAPTQNQS